MRPSTGSPSPGMGFGPTPHQAGVNGGWSASTRRLRPTAPRRRRPLSERLRRARVSEVGRPHRGRAHRPVARPQGCSRSGLSTAVGWCGTGRRRRAGVRTASGWSPGARSAAPGRRSRWRALVQRRRAPPARSGRLRPLPLHTTRAGPASVTNRRAAGGPQPGSEPGSAVHPALARTPRAPAAGTAAVHAGDRSATSAAARGDVVAERLLVLVLAAQLVGLVIGHQASPPENLSQSRPGAAARVR